MTEKELFEQVCSRLNFPKEDLLKIIIEEACESTCDPAKSINDDDKLSTAFVHVGVALQALKGSLKGALQHADTITMNYRGRSFKIGPDHWLMSFELE